MTERRGGTGDAGIADENVELAMPLMQCSAEPRHTVEIGEAERHQGRRAAGFADLVVELFQPALCARHRHDVRAGLGERERRGITDAARGAGHEGDAVGEGSRHYVNTLVMPGLVPPARPKSLRPPERLRPRRRDKAGHDESIDVMPTSLTDRIALVTGASRGIGYATALALAKAGAHIVAVARTQGGLEELDDEIRKAGGAATLVPLSLTDFDGVARLGAALHERHGKLDIFVGNAGVAGPSSPLGHIDLKQWQDTLALNTTANFQLIRCMEPLLRASDAGRAVFITAGSARVAPGYRGPYAASKAALETLVRVWAVETASTPIRVNLFSPGPIRTRMRAAVFPGEDPMTLDTPEQAAEFIVPMCAPDWTESGRLYDYQARKLLSFRAPA